MVLAYNSEGLVKSAKDPMGRTVEYTYESGNLASVTQPGESSLRWQFEYDGSHELTKVIDGRGGETVNKYNSSHQVELQTDPMHRELSFKYEAESKHEYESKPPTTTITNKATGAITKESFNHANELSKVIHGYETSLAAPESFSYDAAGDRTSRTDGDGDRTTYTYDAEGNRTSETDELGDITTWTYDSTHDVMTTTTPKGETTTIERDSHGNATKISRPAPESTTQTTKYTYDSHGDLTSVEDPLKRTWKYEYDTEGDRTSEIDPEGDKRTWTYNEDSQEVSTVAPRGNASGAEAAKYTTTVARDAQGRPLTLTEPLSEPSFVTSFIPEDIEGSFKEPDAVAIDPSGDIWVADSRHNRVVEFDTTHKVLRQFGTEGTGEGQFDGIRGIAADASGDVYVTDYGNDRVQEFGPEGEFKLAFGSLGTSSDHFTGPSAITVDSSGNVWVLDNTAGKLAQEFSSAGEYISGFGTATETLGVGSATGIAISGGDVYLAEPLEHRVEKYSTSGEMLASFDSKLGTGTGESEGPWGIAADPKTGYLYVSETGNNRVQEFEGSGTYVASFGSAGSGAGQFSGPKGLAIGASSIAYVADTNNNRMEEWTAAASSKEPPTFTASFIPEDIEGSFKEPDATAVDPRGDVWVADSGHDRVIEFNPAHKVLRLFGTEGTGEGEFKGIRGIAADASGDVYVTDYGNDRVQEFGPEGEFKLAFGSLGTSNGHFTGPSAITVDSSKHVWVLDNTAGKLAQEFSESGEYITGFGTATATLGVGSATGIAVSGVDIYLTEPLASEVHEYSTSGESLATFDEGGTGTGKSKGPWGIAVDPKTENVYVTETGNNRVQEFKATGTFVAAFGSAGSGAGQFSGPKGAAVGASSIVYVADTNNNRMEQWTGASPRVTNYTYDANGNLETQTDPNGSTTTYTYDADNEPTKVKQPDGTITESEFDGAGQVISQTDGNKHTTKYARNVLEEITEVEDPLKRKTTKEYDKAGNLTSLTDATGRVTSYYYDPDARLSDVSYSDEKTPTVKYEYDADGDRTKMLDGTGETTYTYDQLDRLIESKDGHGDITAYKYDLANEQTQITYPSGKAVTREYDNAGRLKSVTDWLGETTTFSYDRDSDLVTTTFPTSTGDVDAYSYDNSDRMSAVAMSKGTETLASLGYGRDADGQVIGTTSKGLPGQAETGYDYDEDDRLTNAGTTSYEYDAADNPTKTPASANTYNSANEVEAGTGVEYTYDALGERTKRKPTSGPETTYGYDQAGNLTSVSRPKEGSTPAIEDSYGYDGNGLRASQDVSGTTSYLTWDMTEDLPLILSDGINSYIYGPGDLSIEQIKPEEKEEKVLYLHHDQQGSTRMLTGSTGSVGATFTYDTYGNLTGHTGTASSPLGYDGQYTSPDNGLIYMRARTYDPATSQFLSVDPAVSLSQEPYAYAGDNPVNREDAVGLQWIPVAGGAGGADAVCGATIEVPGVDIGTCGAAGVATGAAAVGAAIGIVTAVAGEEGGNDEGEAGLKEREQEDTDCAANRIANGHAFEKHAGEFGAETPEELEQTIRDALENATKSRELSNGRTAYYDEENNTVVIVDPSSPDGGTIFKPSGGEGYFNGLQ